MSDDRRGYIRLSRKISEHWLFQDAERLRWWIDMLLMAAWEDMTWSSDGHTFVLRRGQIVASSSYLSARWKRSRPTVIKFLNMLQSDGMIEREVLFRKTAVITIVNYERYQSEDDEAADALGSLKPYQRNFPATLSKSDTLRCQQKNEFDTLVDTNKREETLISNKVIESRSIANNNRSSGEEVKRDDKREEGENLSLFPCPVEDEKGMEARRADDAMKIWNSVCRSFPKVLLMSEVRTHKLAVRLKEMGGGDAGMAQLRKVFEEMEASSFLKGDNDRGWRANLDWVLANSQNWVKVIEGKYKNRDNDNEDHRSERYDRRRGFGAEATSPEDYKGRF